MMRMPTPNTPTRALEIARAPDAVGAVVVNHLLLILLRHALQVGENGVRHAGHRLKVTPKRRLLSAPDFLAIAVDGFVALRVRVITQCDIRSAAVSALT